jgi:uncharacterized phage-associated protein
MTSDIKFRVNADKVLEALVYIAERKPGIDFFHVCKILFFAEKLHLNTYGRPILGDAYFALDQGPVPSLAYKMIKRDEIRLFGEILENISLSIECEKSKTDNYLRIVAKRSPNNDLFSDSDIECLDNAIMTYADMDYEQLYTIAHADPAYNAVYKAGQKPHLIGYNLILDMDSPHYDEILKDIRENSSLVIL